MFKREFNTISAGLALGQWIKNRESARFSNRLTWLPIQSHSNYCGPHLTRQPYGTSNLQVPSDQARHGLDRLKLFK